MLVQSQTQWLVAAGTSIGWIPIADASGIIIGSLGTLYDDNNGPISVRVESVDRNSTPNRVRLSRNGVYPDLTSYTPAGAARLFLPRQNVTAPQGVAFENPSFSNWRPLVNAFEKIVDIPATPNAILVDEEFHLGPYGMHAVTYRCLELTIIIEKPDGNGGWVATNYPQRGGVLAPSTDPDGYAIMWDNATTMSLPNSDIRSSYGTGSVYTVGQDTGQDVHYVMATGRASAITSYEDGFSRLRVTLRRTDTVYTPEEQLAINALGYRAHILVTCPDLVVWEKEVPIVEADGTLIMDEAIDLSRYGLMGIKNYVSFVAELRRNGKTIRTFYRRESMAGEAYDPPTHPVTILTTGIANGDTPWWNEQNNPNWAGGATLYGDQGLPATGPDGANVHDSGVWSGATIGFCGEGMMQNLRVVAYRNGPIATTYADGTVTRSIGDLKTVGTTGAMDAFIERVGFGMDRTWSGGYLTDPIEITLEPFYDELGFAWSGAPFCRKNGPLAFTIYYGPGSSNSTLSAIFAAIEASDVWQYYKIAPTINNAPTYVLTLNDAGTLSLPPPVLDTSIPVPAGSGDNCTLRMRLLAAPPNRVHEYPFIGDNTQAVAGYHFLPIVASDPTVLDYPLSNSNAGIWAHGNEFRHGYNKIVEVGPDFCTSFDQFKVTQNILTAQGGVDVFLSKAAFTEVQILDNVAFTFRSYADFAAPGEPVSTLPNLTDASIITVLIKNLSGVDSTAATWLNTHEAGQAHFRMAAWPTLPAGYSRTIVFVSRWPGSYDAHWFELWRSPVDVPNDLGS